MEDRGAAAAGEPTAEALERRVARCVVAQSLQAAGFTSARASALDALSAVLLGYLKEAGHVAHEAAEAAGRAQAALPDALVALEALGADVPRLMRHVEQCYAGEADELPFAQPLPRYPVRKRPRCAPSLLETGEPAAAHVPRWAPALPDAHTYAATPAHAPAVPDDRRVRLQLAEQTVGAEGAMARLADRLSPGAPADYTVAAPGRWGGLLTGPGVHARRAEEQALVLASAGGASVPLLRQGAPGGEALALHAPAAYRNPPSLAPILAAPHAEGEAEEAAQPEVAGWQPSEADAPAAEAIRRVWRDALGFRAFTAPAYAFAPPAVDVAQAAAARARLRAGCGERGARRGASGAGLCGGAAGGHVCAAAGARGAAERGRPGSAGQHLDARPAQQRAAGNYQRLARVKRCKRDGRGGPCTLRRARRAALCAVPPRP
jgi:transcription initiation factor TFIID subunit 8